MSYFFEWQQEDEGFWLSAICSLLLHSTWKCYMLLSYADSWDKLASQHNEKPIYIYLYGKFATSWFSEIYLDFEKISWTQIHRKVVLTGFLKKEIVVEGKLAISTFFVKSISCVCPHSQYSYGSFCFTIYGSNSNDVRWERREELPKQTKLRMRWWSSICSLGGI